MDAPDSNPERPGPNAGKPPKPKSEPPILLRLAPLWRLRLCPKKSSNGSSAVKGNRQWFSGLRNSVHKKDLNFKKKNLCLIIISVHLKAAKTQLAWWPVGYLHIQLMQSNISIMCLSTWWIRSNIFFFFAVFSLHQIPQGNSCHFSCYMLHYIHQLTLPAVWHWACRVYWVDLKAACCESVQSEPKQVNLKVRKQKQRAGRAPDSGNCRTGW